MLISDRKWHLRLSQSRRGNVKSWIIRLRKDQPFPYHAERKFLLVDGPAGRCEGCQYVGGVHAGLWVTHGLNVEDTRVLRELRDKNAVLDGVNSTTREFLTEFDVLPFHLGGSKIRTCR